MKLLSYLCCFCWVESVVIAVLALILNPRAAMNRAVALAAFVYSLWAFGMMFAYGSDEPLVRVGFYRFSFLGSLFIAPCLLWLYLLMTEVSRRVRWWCVGLSLTYSVAMLAHYFVAGFFYESFRDGPWGDIGVPSTNGFWATVTPYVSVAQIAATLVLMVRTRKRTESERLRRQLGILIPGVLLTFVLYFLAWLLEILLALPNMMVLAGSVLVTVNFGLIAWYRYLRQDSPLLEKHLVNVVQDSVFLLDVNRNILGANAAALERLSLTEADLVGKDFRSLLDDPSLLDREWQLAAEGRSLHRGQPCQLAGRSVFLTLSPRFDRFGDPVATVVLVGDMGRFDDRTAEAGITAREKQLLLLSLQGRNFAEIADALGISPATVKTHMHHICEKTGSANRVEVFGRLLGLGAAPV